MSTGMTRAVVVRGDSVSVTAIAAIANSRPNANTVIGRRLGFGADERNFDDASESQQLFDNSLIAVGGIVVVRGAICQPEAVNGYFRKNLLGHMGLSVTPSLQ